MLVLRSAEDCPSKPLIASAKLFLRGAVAGEDAVAVACSWGGDDPQPGTVLEMGVLSFFAP
jgi:hypothetical protein